MHRFFSMATLLLTIAVPFAFDDDPKELAAFAEIAKRLEKEIERLEGPAQKAATLVQLAEIREKAKDFEGAKRTSAQAIEQWLAPGAIDPRQEMIRQASLVQIAGLQDRIGDRTAALATLSKAREAVLASQNDNIKISSMSSIVRLQREMDDREGIAETVRKANALLKEKEKLASVLGRRGDLLGIQANSGDIQGALQSLHDDPMPSSDFLSGRIRVPDRERQSAFFVLMLSLFAQSCRVGDEEALRRIAKAIHTIDNPQRLNSGLTALVLAQINLKQLDEAARTAASIEVSPAADQRYLLLSMYRALAEAQFKAHDKGEAQHSIQKAAHILDSFGADGPQPGAPTVVPPTPPAGNVRPPNAPRFERTPPYAPIAFLLAAVGERAEAVRLIEKLKPVQRIGALEDLADVDELVGRREEMTATRKKALELAESVVSEAESPNAEGDIPSQKVRRLEGLRAIVRLRVRMSELPKAIELVTNAAEIKDNLRLVLIQSLGRVGDATAAFTQIDEFTEPRMRIQALNQLATSLTQRREAKALFEEP